MSDEYRLLPVTIIGLDIPELGDEASMLAITADNEKIAITVDFTSLLHLLENSTKAVEEISLRLRGRSAHIPSDPTAGYDPEHPNLVALELRFGTIGAFRASVTTKQAQALAENIGSALQAAKN